MEILKKHGLEIVGCIWLILVAVQFLGQYFINGLNVDFLWAYFVMICLSAIVVTLDLLKWVQSRGDKKHRE